ncbi:Hsp70 family protein [Williamsia maris]|uniref:Hsp70 protein n=1 Tax=Williamsia maris TaxID=72806 RepID=A0ABT1HHN5_9NOCA|nr:Hsp70 family protein [Williamsia maris]MCP2176535.1 Hsp70 protein [Williamsia maris]
MASGLGLKIGSSASVAVSTTRSGTYDALVRQTALELAPGRAPVLAAAGAVSAGSPDLAGFTQRVGDPVALVADDGRQFSGEELYATALACLARESGSDASSVVVACPNGWQAYTVDALRAAAATQGLSDVTFVPEAIAAVAAAEATRPDGLASGGVPRSGGSHAAVTDTDTDLVVVYDLGGSALDIAVVRTGEASQIIGRPVRSEDISGDAFDQLILTHVLESVSALDDLDPFAPDTVESLATLRRRCTAAKEALSSDTDTTVSVELPDLRTETRLVRSEVEDLLHEPIATSLTLLRETVAGTGHSLSDVTAIILTGGGSAVPLITEMMSSMLRVPVIVDADPVTTSAFGAAILAGEIDSAAAALDAMPANAAAAVADLAAARKADLVPAQTRAVEPAPRTTVVEKIPMGRNKRLAIIGGVAVAIALLTAGGLSVGTALSGDEAPAATPTQSAPATSGAPSASAGRSASAGSTPGAGSTGASAAPNTGSGGTAGTGGGAAQSPGTGGGSGSGSQNNGGTGSGSNGSTGGGTGGNTGGGNTGTGNTGGDTGGGSTGGGNTGGGDTGGGDTGGNAPPETAGRPTIPTLPTLPNFPGRVAQVPGNILGGVGDTVGGILGAN